MRLFVGNFPWSTDDDELRSVFSEVGEVVSCQIIMDRETGKSRGFGFVEMGSAAEGDDAIATLNGTKMGGRSLRVTEAHERAGR